MFTLFPERSDDLLDTAALPPTENTELNYRTRPLTSGQEWRLIGLLLFGSLPAMLTLSFVIHSLCSAIRNYSNRKGRFTRGQETGIVSSRRPTDAKRLRFVVAKAGLLSER